MSFVSFVARSQAAGALLVSLAALAAVAFATPWPVVSLLVAAVAFRAGRAAEQAPPAESVVASNQLSFSFDDAAGAR